MEEQEQKTDSDYIPVEDVSFSFIFFVLSGITLLVTLWAFWDDEFSRRGYKAFQGEYFKTEYARAETEWKQINTDIADNENQLKTNLRNETGRLENSDEFQRLVDIARVKEINLFEILEDKKFAGSHLDEAFYYYKKAMHKGDSYDVQLAKVKKIEVQIKDFSPLIAEAEKERDSADTELLEFKAKEVSLNKELTALTMQREQVELTMDYYKPFPFIWRPAEILQTVIPGFGFNSFSEIIYRVDRCMTCHISYEDDYYKDHPEPLKSHPNLDLLIKKHPPGRTGCTWCHLGQGSATAPAEHAHGSPHETDQTTEINEPILQGDFMQSTCRNCHDDVRNLEGAPILSEGKNLFLKLGCHGCHLALGFETEDKVGPRLTRINSKVNPSWLYRWVQDPREYLPKTRMPDFGFSKKEALAVTAYLVAASDKEYKLPVQFKGGTPANGKKLFESVGCQACHTLNGKGEKFAPDLSNIGNKVNVNWLVSWIDNPAHYNNRSKMPDLRLTTADSSDIAAYLIQFGKPKHIKGIESLLNHPEVIEKGEKIARRRGCFACHDIKGMEAEGRIAPELSSFGRKMISELEFGDAHIPHNWESWVRTKLKKPDSFATERVLDKMPNFHLTPDEINSLVVLLKGFNGTKVPIKYRKIPTDKEKILERGRRLITKFNCKGCHNVEGEGGLIQKYLELPTQYPPPLDEGTYHVGERIKASWLYSFLQNPTPVRTWVKTKMPTFNFSSQEVRDLTSYFEALAPGDVGYESGINVSKTDPEIEAGAKIVNYMDCGKCHDDGEKGIDFSIAGKRLRQDWIPKWLKDTREMIPWTKMPSHWPKKGDKYLVKAKFSELETVGSIDTQINAISDFIISYNTPGEADFDLVLGEGDDDEEGDEEEGDEEDEEEEE